MVELTLSTPSILFSAISLIMLAYTNRFLSYAAVIRSLVKDHREASSSTVALQIASQIANLRRRLYLTRMMQILGILSLLLCVVCTFLIYVGMTLSAAWTFGAALLLLVVSLGVSIAEIQISVRALETHLDGLSDK